MSTAFLGQLEDWHGFEWLLLFPSVAVFAFFIWWGGWFLHGLLS